MKKQTQARFRVAFILIAAIAIFLSSRQCLKKINENLEAQLQQSLQDVASQNVIALEKEVESTQNLLLGIADELRAYPNQENLILDMLTPVVSTYHLKRLGIITRDGIVHTTDGYTKDLSFRDFFQRGMEGKSVITDTLEDSMGTRELINVFSMPYYEKDGTTIAGVLFATYRTIKFQESLAIESFDGEGYSCIVDSNGNVVANSKKSPMYGTKNIFSCLTDYSKENQETVDSMILGMSRGESGRGSYLYEGERLYYYTPVNIPYSDSQWYMLTIVPANVLNQRTEQITNNVHQLFLSGIMVVVFCLLLYLIYSYRSKKELLRLAYVDPLTDGDNYACFEEKMRQMKKTSGYLLSLDLNEFKTINSICGTQKGDETLRQVWNIIQKNIRNNELAAHVSADHFVIFMKETEKSAVETRIRMMSTELASLSDILNVPPVIPFFGICQTDHPDEVEKYHGHANRAKNQIKERRDRNYAFYDEVDYQQLMENRELEADFNSAIQSRRIEIWYQPKYSAQNSVIVGAEALVRWRKTDGTLVPPGRFIPLFEKNGLIPRLDEYVFTEVCRQQKQWQMQGFTLLPVSVNISRTSLYYSDIIDRYKAIMEEYELDFRYVQLEITESATIDNTEIARLVEEFHAAGFQVLLDDFGSGYSSLSTLNQMNFDTLKLDKSLIDYIGNEKGEKLLNCIISFAKSLGLAITAEGVETKEQLSFLQRLQCNDIQGFYFSKPLPLANYQALL